MALFLIAGAGVAWAVLTGPLITQTALAYITVPLPTGIKASDTLVATIRSATNNWNTTTKTIQSTGWTLLSDTGDQIEPPSNRNHQRTTVWQSVATAGEGGQTWSSNGNDLVSGQIVDNQGVAIATPTPTATSTIVPTPTPTSTPISGAMTMPIEVIGATGTTVSATFSLTSAQASAAVAIYIQCNNCSYRVQTPTGSNNWADKAGVSVNGSTRVNLDNNTVTMTEPWETAGGGIGGPFNTLKFTLPIPTGSNLVAGNNTITFTFNGTDGIGSGFRILAFNLEDANSNMLLPSSDFTAVNPATWTAPLNDQADINAGQTLWQSASLVSSPGGSPILAHCQDCHAMSGRDLKYFNFSNYAIEARSVFHGLSQLQGEQIASYIRAGLPNVPNPGFPWNPPYQPGPGLLSQPVANWAAGAGLSAALDNDIDALPYLFPDGIGNINDVAVTGWVDFAEIPEALQFQDWNHWLPTVAPVDTWGSSTWFNSSMYQRYLSMRSNLTNNSMAYISGAPPSQPSNFNQDLFKWVQPDRASLFGNACASNAGAGQVLDTGHWQVTKNWEINQDFGLESLLPSAEQFNASVQAITPSATVDRAWDGDVPFMISANRLCGAGKQSNVFTFTPNKSLFDEVIANSWYNLQIELNSGYRSRNANNPIDWGYEYDAIGKMHWFYPYPTPVLFAEVTTRAMQENVDPARAICAVNNGTQCLDQSYGWNPTWGGEIQELVFSEFINAGFGPFWNALPDSTQCQQSSPYICTGPDISAIMTALLTTWFQQVQLYPPAQYYAIGIASPNYVPIDSFNSGNWGDRIYDMIPLFGAYGVNPSLLHSVCNWAATVWPNGNWSSLPQCGG